MSARLRPQILLCALSLPTMLAGCASSGTAPPPARVEVPAECERILQEVAPPAVKPGDDFRVIAGRAGPAVKTANSRIKAARACLAAQRQRYGRMR